MKKITKSAIAGTLAVFVLVAAVWARTNANITVVNKTFNDLGVVTIYNGYGAAGSVTVSGSGRYDLQIDGSPVAATINNQGIPNNGTTIDVTLASGVIVEAKWTGNQIIVQDQSVMQGEPKPHGK